MIKYDINNLKGFKINRLTILEEGDKIKDGNKNRRGVICKCDCGVTKLIPLLKLMKGLIKSCGGCYENLVGKVNGQLEVIEDLGLTKNNNRLLKVRCNACGSEKKYLNTIFNKRIHCGCIKNKIKTIKPIPQYIIKGIYLIHHEIDIKSEGGHRMVKAECTKCNEIYNLVYKSIDANPNKLGCAKCGIKNYIKPNKLSETDIKLRYTLRSMKSRCYNIKNKDYKNYGGRGIEICDNWLNNKESFCEWSINNGYEKGLEIDRENNDLGYSPENCRWVKRVINNRNKRDIKLNEDLVREIRYGKYKDIPRSQIAEIIGCSKGTIDSIFLRKSWKDI